MDISRKSMLEWGISDDLLNELRKLFPDKCPALGIRQEEVWYCAGQASVVKKLELMQKE